MKHYCALATLLTLSAWPAVADTQPQSAVRWAVEKASGPGTTVGFHDIDGVEHVDLMRVTPETGTYSHHPHILHDGERFFATWSNHRVDEDGPGQRVLFSTSTDGRQWTDPAECFPPLGPAEPAGGQASLVLTSNGLHRIGGAVYAVAGINGIGPHRFGGRPCYGNVARSVGSDGTLGPMFMLADEPPPSLEGFEHDIAPPDDPRFANPAAELIALRYRSDNWPSWSFRPAGPGHEDYTVATGSWKSFGHGMLAADGHRMCEPTSYRRPDGVVVRLFRDLNRSQRVYAAVFDEATETWSVPHRTNIPDSPSRAVAGRLPNGGVYLVGNQTWAALDGRGGRDPLVLSTSRDGVTFDQAWIIRTGAPRVRHRGKHKGPGFQYPHATVVGDDLWVIYSINKEDVAVTRAPLKAVLAAMAMMREPMRRTVPVTLAAACSTVVSCTFTTADEPPPDHSRVPGVVVAHSPQASGIYIGSAGIVVLPDGTYLAKHDEFGPSSTERNSAVTHVYRSTDRGRSWEHLVKVDGLFWANIFHHQNAVYMMGTSAGHRHGHCVIRRSDDGGRTWTEAKDETTGLLFPNISYHTAPMPAVIHDGRIWRAMEDEQGGDRWGHSFRTFMMSAPVDADLLAASNWTASNAIARDPSWLGGQFGGWLEGNAVVDPDGRIVNILRVAGLEGKAAVVRISDDGKKASFDPESGFIDLPGGTKKFLIRRDPRSGTYWALSNPAIGGSVRNTLALMHSDDLIDWEIRCILLHHPDPVYHAFQYPDWVFDGDDMLVASRTAYDDGVGGARRAHDANYLTFHRFDNFRELTLADSVVDPEDIGRGPRATIELGEATVEGRGFTRQTLRNDSVAFANRKYVWENVPEKLQGWHYTQTAGGANPQMRVSAKRDTVLYLATSTRQPGIDTAGWEPVPELAFRYTDGGRTSMEVLRRAVKAGEAIDVPQGNWTGGLLLAAPER